MWAAKKSIEGQRKGRARGCSPMGRRPIAAGWGAGGLAGRGAVVRRRWGVWMRVCVWVRVCVCVRGRSGGWKRATGSRRSQRVRVAALAMRIDAPVLARGAWIRVSI